MLLQLLQFFNRAMPLSLALVLSGVLMTVQAVATETGWRQIRIPGSTANTAATVVALYYPTQAPARTIAMGPFTTRVAIQAQPDPTVKGLIVFSHGIGGSELGHSSLAEALAQHGYLVAALRHPGDNWQDRSLLQVSPERYFATRPQQVSHVLNELLRDPDWRNRIARDAKGPRIGAVGHSAGGYTVLALAGGQPDLSRIATHCQAHRADDPIFCSMGRTGQPQATPVASAASIPPLIDTRVRAVVALAPVGVVFSPESLAKIQIRAAIYVAEKDRFLVPRFHAEWIARNLPGVELRRVPNAWHFAFVDTPSMPIPSEDGDIGANPPGFDRQAFLQQLRHDLPLFFDNAYR
jgi:predicted dienelactone hydrolase